MMREIVTAGELATWLTAELNRLPDFEACRVAPPIAAPPDPTGCNWSPVVHVTCGNAIPAMVERAIQEPLGRARTRFNLAV